MPHETSPNLPQSTRPLECPRCGHHLDGNAIAAEARGEHSGVCTECGLSVVWASLRADAVSPKWFVESKQSSLRMPRRVGSTLLHCLRPFHFWTSINLALPLSTRGIIAFLIGIAVMLYVVAVGQRIAFVFPQCVLRFQWNTRDAMSQTTADLALAIISPTTRFSGAEILSYGRPGNTPKTELTNYLQTAGRFALLVVYPMRREFRFDLGTAPNTNAMNSLTLTPREPPLLWREQIPSTISSMACALLAPLSMLLLPTSLRRARIRPRHFARLLLYSTALVIPIFALSLALPHFGTMYGDWMFGFVTLYGSLNAGFILLVCTTVLVSIWMTAAAARYLRLEHGVGVGVSCALLSSLLVTLLQQWQFVL